MLKKESLNLLCNIKMQMWLTDIRAAQTTGKIKPTFCSLRKNFENSTPERTKKSKINQNCLAKTSTLGKRIFFD